MTEKEMEEKNKKHLERVKLYENTIINNKNRLFLCPFCGDFPILERNKHSGSFINIEYHARCDCMQISTPYYRNIELVIKKWNTRAAIAESPAIIQQPLCASEAKLPSFDEVFKMVKQHLCAVRDSGTLWKNIGDDEIIKNTYLAIEKLGNFTKW